MSKKRKIPVLKLVLVGGLVFAAALAAAPADSGDDEKAVRAARGKVTYRIYCQNCHGKLGTGDGPIGEMLKVKPADLTQLAKAEGGFSAQRAYQIIDGREEVQAHGRREMPIWGLAFQDPGRDSNQEEEVKDRILNLVAYLESIQTSPSEAGSH